MKASTQRSKHRAPPTPSLGKGKRRGFNAMLHATVQQHIVQSVAEAIGAINPVAAAAVGGTHKLIVM